MWVRRVIWGLEFFRAKIGDSLLGLKLVYGGLWKSRFSFGDFDKLMVCLNCKFYNDCNLSLEIFMRHVNNEGNRI